MKFISTRNHLHGINFHDALLQGLAPDGGLYIPSEFPLLPKNFLEEFENASLTELGEVIIKNFLPEIPEQDLKTIIQNSLNFPIPLIQLSDNLFLLEVFHGPTLAFKDVGARFMANVLSYFLKKNKINLSIIVATSGDTGSAIAHGFYDVPNINVFILYPSKKITLLQEKQMTTLGKNIHALEVLGTFDDCQRLVKSALLDKEIREKRSITTANSINIARLLPQVIYHSWGITQLKKSGISTPATLSVPSGNFGNLTAAIYAKRIGLPVNHFIAATNSNAIVPYYLQTGKFTPQESLHTLSNAMDVGNPSNFERLLSLYSNNYTLMREEITGISISDEQTLKEIRYWHEKTCYILDPHTAVGVAAATHAQKLDPDHNQITIVTATAHPAKFPEVIKEALNLNIELPESLQNVLKIEKKSKTISTKADELKSLLLTI